MIAAIIFGIPIAAFAYIGRMSVPAVERLPLGSWGIRGLARNLWQGLTICSAETPLARTLNDLERWQHAARGRH
ncbi:hypothetical protein [Arthrobacter sp. TMN-50]